MKTQRQIYEYLYLLYKKNEIRLGINEDAASRRANIFAVKNTWEVFNNQNAPVLMRGE